MIQFVTFFLGWWVKTWPFTGLSLSDLQRLGIKRSRSLNHLVEDGTPFRSRSDELSWVMDLFHFHRCDFWEEKLYGCRHQRVSKSKGAQKYFKPAHSPEKKLTWNPKMKIWKMFFCFERVMFRFHVSFLGSKICIFTWWFSKKRISYVDVFQKIGTIGPMTFVTIRFAITQVTPPKLPLAGPSIVETGGFQG